MYASTSTTEGSPSSVLREPRTQLTRAPRRQMLRFLILVLALALVPASIADSAPTSAPLPGWHLGNDNGESCSNLCARRNLLCDVRPIKDVRTAAHIVAGMTHAADGRNPCDDVNLGALARSSPAMRFHGSSVAACEYGTAGGPQTRTCEDEGGVTDRRLCCCSALTGPVAGECPLSLKPCAQKGRTEDECPADECVFIKNWGRFQLLAKRDAIQKRLVAQRTKLSKRAKRRLRRRQGLIVRELAACEGGCQVRDGPCRKFCRTICTVRPECQWSGSSGCVHTDKLLFDGR